MTEHPAVRKARALAKFCGHLSARYPDLGPDQLDALAAETDRAAARLVRVASALSIALKQAREQAVLTQAEVAAKLDWSPSKIIRIEGDQIGITTTDLRALLACYGVSDAATVENLTGQARERRTRRRTGPRTTTRILEESL